VGGGSFDPWEGWVVGPSIYGKGIETVTPRKRTLAVGCCSIVAPLIVGQEICSDSEESHGTLSTPLTDSN
jgi:hypothetical protein